MSVPNTSRQLIQIEAIQQGWTVSFPPEDHETDYYTKGHRRIRVVYNRRGSVRYGAVRYHPADYESYFFSSTRPELIKELRRKMNADKGEAR